MLQTGLTRDGTFLIEKGKITRALKNFRWNESPLLMLNRLEDIGRSEPTAAGRLMPALRVSRFDFSSHLRRRLGGVFAALRARVISSAVAFSLYLLEFPHVWPFQVAHHQAQKRCR